MHGLNKKRLQNDLVKIEKAIALLESLSFEFDEELLNKIHDEAGYVLMSIENYDSEVMAEEVASVSIGRE